MPSVKFSFVLYFCDKTITEQTFKDNADDISNGYLRARSHSQSQIGSRGVVVVKNQPTQTLII